MLEDNYIYSKVNVNNKNDSESFESAKELFLYEYITNRLDCIYMVEKTEFKNRNKMFEELGSALIPSDFVNYELLDNIFDSVIDKYKV